MMQRAVIIAKGRVQKVGYRDIVQDIARTFGVVGYVENLRDGNVKIVAEADKSVLEKFIEQVKITKDFIDVTDDIVKYEDATREFEIFEIRYGKVEEELGDRMGAAILYLGATNKKIDEGREENKKGFSILADKQDQMLDLQKQTLNKQDQMLEKQDQTIEILGGKIDNGFEKMGDKIDKGNKMLGEKIDNGFNKIDNDFAILRSDYGKISQTMEKILDCLVQQQKDSTEATNRLTAAILKLAEKR